MEVELVESKRAVINVLTPLVSTPLVRPHARSHDDVCGEVANSIFSIVPAQGCLLLAWIELGPAFTYVHGNPAHDHTYWACVSIIIDWVLMCGVACTWVLTTRLHDRSRLWYVSIINWLLSLIVILMPLIVLRGDFTTNCAPNMRFCTVAASYANMAFVAACSMVSTIWLLYKTRNEVA